MNLITFINYSNQIPIVLGLFGKENLEYISEFDAGVFENSRIQIYYHRNLNTKIYFFREHRDFINQSIEFFNEFDKKLIFIENLDAPLLHSKFEEIENGTKCFIWHYAEVFDKQFMKQIQQSNYSIILSGSKRPEMENDDNFELDLLLPFRYFRYFIGYYYLETLLNNMDVPKYNKNKPKLFSYIRAHNSSSWRNEILNLTDLSGLMETKNSANDAYDLLYPKYKHFETINDYMYCNFNMVFETIDYRNIAEYFITEKTYKALFFGKPFILVAPAPVLNYLKSKGFYLLNFKFKNEIKNAEDVVDSVTKFTEWLKTEKDDIVEETYNECLNNSILNRKILFDYLNDYSQSEKIFKNLLNK